MLSRLMTRREQMVIGSIAFAVLVGSATVYWTGRDSSATPLPSPGTPQPPPARGVAAEVEAPAVSTVQPIAQPQAAPVRPALVAVSIQGAVNSPGLYRLTSEDRVQDLIDEADGLNESADTSDINLAAKLIDGTTLTIPGGASDASMSQSSRRRSQPVWNPAEYTIAGWRPDAPQTTQTNSIAANINTLASVPPGAGATTRANGLIDLNQATQQDLETLPGIGPKLAQAIIDYRNLAPFRSVEDLLEVTGIGEKRLEAIRPMVTVQ